MMNVNIGKVNRIFGKAEEEGRDFLLETEVYELLRSSGIVPPRYIYLEAGRRINRKDLSLIPSRSVVVKIVSPLILHKSDVGGVEVVGNRAASVNAACERMLGTVPSRFRLWKRKTEESHKRRKSDQTSASIRDSIRGFLICERVEYDDFGFGSELLIGLRNSRDFGPVMTVGGGGTDVEFMNENLKEGRGAATSSVHLLPEGRILELLEPLAFFGKAAAEFRGKKAALSRRVLEQTCRRIQALAAAYSPYSDQSPFVIEDAEVNPFVVRRGRLVPLDGVCRFSRDKHERPERPLREIGGLLRPSTIGIIGVSKSMNIGRIILDNILKSGFPSKKVFVVKSGVDDIAGCRCVPSIVDLPGVVDLFVLTLAADQCYQTMREIVEYEKARSVIIIAGGMGEKEGGANIEEGIRSLLAAGRRKGKAAPVVNGGNSLGISSKPGRYDTTFIPETKHPRARSRDSHLAFLSQSGAFMLSQQSKLPRIEPLYSISLGNQIDLTVSDYFRFLKDDPEVRVFAVYMEGFKPHDGFSFAEAVREITSDGKRSVLVYKAGRSPEGRAATSSHTASIAGEYGVFHSVLEQAGAVVADNLFEFESFLKGFVYLDKKRVGGRRAGFISNAGFECVLMADNLKNGSALDLAGFSSGTRRRIVSLLSPLGIDRLQDVHNPLDVTPVADDEVFCECARAILDDPGVDCAVVSNVPMTPAMQTLARGSGHREDFTKAGSFAPRITEIFRSVEKPFVVNIDAGRLYDPLAAHLEDSGIPVFRRADEAVRFLRAFVRQRLK